mgnify:CR=1 FL=1
MHGREENMAHQAVWALAIFLVVYAFIISGKIHRTVATMAGALLAAALGLGGGGPFLERTVHALGLMIGMMILTGVTAETGAFRFLAVWAARKAQGDPGRLLIWLALVTAAGAAFLNEHLAVLVMAPVTLWLTRLLGVSPLPYLLAQAAAAAAGGTATLAGSASNMMIGSAVRELEYSSFIVHLAPVAALILLVNLGLIILLYRNRLRALPERMSEVMGMEPAAQVTDRKLLVKCMAAIVLTVAGLFFHNVLNVAPAVVALSGAFLLLLMAGGRAPVHALARVDWTVVFCVGGLLAVSSALAETGAAAWLAGAVANFTGSHMAAAAMLILGTSALASAWADNLPFVAVMIPVIQEMGAWGASNQQVLWWSLALGAGLGGSGTLIGAGAGLPMAAMAAKEGRAIRFAAYLKAAFPLMLLSVALAGAYVYLRYLL